MKNIIFIIILALSIPMWAGTPIGNTGYERCEVCNGGGCAMDCSACMGKGYFKTACPICKATGMVGKTVCKRCRGLTVSYKYCRTCMGTGCSIKCNRCNGVGFYKAVGTK